MAELRRRLLRAATRRLGTKYSFLTKVYKGKQAEHLMQASFGASMFFTGTYTWTVQNATMLITILNAAAVYNVTLERKTFI